jgi:outer membrane protein TolC
MVKLTNQKMNNYRFVLSVVLSFTIGILHAQSKLTLEQCYDLAKKNYPLVKQMELVSKTAEYTIQNASKGYLPQISLNGQATYQSDVTGLPINVPNIEKLSKDQYKLYADLSQVVYDGGIISQQKKIQQANAEVEQEKIEVELYKLKERINQLYFGVLMIEGQLTQVELLKKDINTGLEKVNAGINNGVALKINADVLKAELLKAEQKTIELKSARNAYLTALGLFVNQTLDENTGVEQPVINASLAATINRPELKLFEVQNRFIDTQSKLITRKNLPKVGLFGQAGYGRPALNMLNNKFDTYYIGGVRFNWALSGFYTMKNERQLLDVNRKMIDVQKEVFLFNTNVVLSQQNSELNKLRALMQVDNQIIDLRKEIKNTAKTQLENGVISSNDYLREINAEDQARQNLLLHEIQLLMAGYNYKTTSGN